MVARTGFIVKMGGNKIKPNTILGLCVYEK